jgi:hypothetical protein
MYDNGVEFSYSQQDCKFLMLLLLVAIWHFVARHECLGFHDGKKERKKKASIHVWKCAKTCFK